MPKTAFAEYIHAEKHRLPGETFEAAMKRISNFLGGDPGECDLLFQALLEQRILPAGRIQRGAGTNDKVTMVNCFVSGTIEDNFTDVDGIMQRAMEAAKVGRAGGGIGYDFSTLRPAGAVVHGIGGVSSGPMGFLPIFDSICAATSSAGNRRGAQMAVLRVDHPDIEAFVTAKSDNTTLTNFNLSVAVTDKFMDAVKSDSPFELVFGGKVYETIKARTLWQLIMRQTWDYAEPGVLFIDRINQQNNLSYCETIATTNPCAEQVLPPFGSCVLGSINLVKYIGNGRFNYATFVQDVRLAVRMLDRVVTKSLYPIHEQQVEGFNKRRIGLGITGLANALELVGLRYGSIAFIEQTTSIMRTLRNTAYRASIELAQELGSFPLFDQDNYLASPFIKTLPPDIRMDIRTHGIRNSHLLSIAPTGTISIGADNVSSGIEPVFAHEYERKVRTPTGFDTYTIKDYAWGLHGVKCKTTEETSVQEHLAVLLACQGFVDSACSKTCNVGSHVTFEEFQDIYMMAYVGGAKGCTTFRSAGKRFGVLVAKHESINVKPKKAKKKAAIQEGTACAIDPVSGHRSCS